MNRKLPTILLVALAFAGGYLFGTRRTGDAPARDQVVKVVTVKRTVDNDPGARTPVETHRLRVYRVSTGDAPTPPDGAKWEGIWVISLTDDTITGNLTGTHYYAVPE